MNDARAHPSAGGLRLSAAALLPAAALPPLLAYNVSPSATAINQCLSVALWGLWLCWAAPLWRHRSAIAFQASLAVLVVSVIVSFGVGQLPLSLALSGVGLLVAAALLAHGAAAEAARAPVPVWRWAAWGLLLAGLGSAAVALMQVFAPQWVDGNWVAHSALAGRAVGNLRQPNHLCTLLLWALVALVSLHELGSVSARWAWPLAGVLVFAVELSASRTGAVALLLLLGWGLLDRRLSRSARWLLALSPVLYGLSYAAMSAYAHLSDQAVGAAARVAAEATLGGTRNGRLNIWSNAIDLIRAQPGTGVGFGEFNLAWSLSPFENRPTAFFDHCHNLVLQLLAELGVPLGLLCLALLALAVWRAWRNVARREGDAGLAGRAALMVVAVVLLHSQVEYPLWYAYFLLPAAWSLGFASGVATGSPAMSAAPAAALAERPRGVRPAAVLGLVMAASGIGALVDYHRVTAIYSPQDGDTRTLAQRVAAGQRSPLFAHHADYAAATNPVPAAQAALGFSRAVHNLLDTRLMQAWAARLAQQGDVEMARVIAQRLRDFGHAQGEGYFDGCERPASAADFMCQAPEQAHGWREFALPDLVGP